MENAATADNPRQAAAALCPVVRCRLLHAGERVGFIFDPNTILFRNKAFYSEIGISPSHKNSNNPLAVKPETENDTDRLNFFTAGTFEIYFG